MSKAVTPVTEEELRGVEKRKLEAEIENLQRSPWQRPGTWMNLFGLIAVLGGTGTGWMLSSFEVDRTRIEVAQARLDLRQETEEARQEAKAQLQIALQERLKVESAKKELAALTERIEGIKETLVKGGGEEATPELAQAIERAEDASASVKKTLDAPVKYREQNEYELTEDFEFLTPIVPESEIVTEYVRLDKEGKLSIGRGYTWSGTTGPIVDSEQNYRASLVHSALYGLMRHGELSNRRYRKTADELYRDLSIEDGLSRFRAELYYNALRKFGKPRTIGP